MVERTANVAAQRLIARACRAHGGIDAWESTQPIRGQLDGLRGPIPWFKGLGRTFAPPQAFTAHCVDRRVEWHDYPVVGAKTIFRIESDGAEMSTIGASGDEVRCPGYRKRFEGLAKWRFWQPQDAAYFFGYALLTYFSVPFILNRLELVRADESSVTVAFPATFDTHCRVQRFWCDETGLIVRHDYDANVLGSTFRGAHFTSNFTDVAGLRLATRRRVYPRLPGGHHVPLLVLAGDLSFCSSEA